jgi:hypothetical protein
VAGVLGDGLAVGAVTSHTITNVTANHTIAASFAIDQFTITATAGANGSIAPSGAVVVDYGNDQAFTITPDVGYHVADVLVDGLSVGAVTLHTITNVTADHTIAASFAIDQFTITATATSGGTITPVGAIQVSYGASQGFTITPDTGFHISDVLVDGGSVGIVTSQTFTNVTANHTIDAFFEANPPVPAITTLAASQVRTGNAAGSTTGITLSWSDAQVGATVQVYRAPFGDYPEYDDGSGAAPGVPVYPPAAPWSLTAVTASGQVDATGLRDFYYFVAFATDQYGTVSPASNMTTGTLNYHLGDVSDGVTIGLGDNLVSTADLSLLGAHYGLTGAAVAPYAYLDVGPTTDFSKDGRPTTDNQIEFEDLVLFSINFNLVSAPHFVIRPAVADVSNTVILEAANHAAAGETIVARLVFPRQSSVQGLSVALSWDPGVVVPVSASSADEFGDQGGVVMSATPGTIDAALLGVRGSGIAGPVGSVAFKAIAPGDPMIRIESVRARDGANRRVDLVVEEPVAAPKVPRITSLSAPMPNPFRGAATIEYGLARRGHTELALYSVDGRRVRVLASGAQEAGFFRVQWDGRDQTGRAVSPGVYYVRLVTPDGAFTRTVVNLR